MSYAPINGLVEIQMVSLVWFSEESNFHISEVLTKVKLRGSEAGWIVRISEVTEDEHGAQ